MQATSGTANASQDLSPAAYVSSAAPEGETVKGLTEDVETSPRQQLK